MTSPSSKTDRLTPAQLDAALAPRFECSHDCGGKYGHDAMCPTLSVLEVAAGEARKRGATHMWWNLEWIALQPVPLQLAGLAEVARMRGPEPSAFAAGCKRVQLDVTGKPLASPCSATHGDAMCLLEHGHHGRHVGRLSAAAQCDWDDQP